MRSKNSLINIAVSLGGQVLSFVLAIVSRAALARLLPPQYLGVNSLFSNILNVLSLAEMGIGVAMIYALYEPVANNDTDREMRLINLYGKMYRLVALAVAGIGLALIPFLNVLIRDASSVENLVLIYLMYLAQSVSSYLFIYKTALITAHQKEYIINLYTCGFNLLMRVLQVIALILTKNYMLFLLIYIVCTVAPNVLASVRAEKMYPYIKGDRRLLPSQEEQKEIFANIRACFVHKIGDVAVYNTDNLIMSSFLGLASVGVYTNYSLISSTLTGMANKVFAACSASIGNLTAVESKEHVQEVFDVFFFLDYLIFSFCAVGLANAFRPFILFTYGESYIMEETTVFLLISCFYIDGMRQAVCHFRNAYGIFREDKWRVLPEILMNLVVSVVLVKKIGLPGIVAGTIISELAFPLWCEPLYLFKCGFRDMKMMYSYCGKFVFRTVLLAVIIFVSRLITDHFPDGSFLTVIIKGLIGSAVYGAVILLVYGRSRELKGILGYLKKALRRDGE